MTTKKKVTPSKNLKLLAQDDYVSPERGTDFSDSDILAPQGVDPKHSDNESRDAGAQKTLARSEEEDSQTRKEALEQLSDGELNDLATRVHLTGRSGMTRRELINALSQAS